MLNTILDLESVSHVDLSSTELIIAIHRRGCPCLLSTTSGT